MKSIAAALACWSIATAGGACADDAHYYPTVSGPPAAVVAGRLVDLGFGMASGGLTIRTAAGRTIDIYAAAPPFRIDGRAIDCPLPPVRGFVPRGDECPSFPAYVVVGTANATTVRVAVWNGRRDGKRTLVAAGFTTNGRRVRSKGTYAPRGRSRRRASRLASRRRR